MKVRLKMYDRFSIMVTHIKLQLSNIWSSMYEKAKQHWGWVKKKSVAHKNSVYAVWPLLLQVFLKKSIKKIMY